MPITDDRVLEIAAKHMRCGPSQAEIIGFARALLGEHEASKRAPAILNPRCAWPFPGPADGEGSEP